MAVVGDRSASAGLAPAHRSSKSQCLRSIIVRCSMSVLHSLATESARRACSLGGGATLEQRRQVVEQRPRQALQVSLQLVEAAVGRSVSSSR